MNYNLEIQKILLRMDKLSDPEDKINLAKEAIRIADTNNDLDWGFDLRMFLVHAEQYTSHSTESIAAFAWILNAHDSNPGMFSEETVLLDYKWIASVIFNNLDVTLEQVQNILDDFRKRCLSNGYTSREYYGIKCNQSLFLGDKQKARKYLELRDREPYDGMTSIYNEKVGTVYVEMYEGKFEEAIAHIKEFETQRSLHKQNIIPMYVGLIYYLGGKTYNPIIDEYFEKADKEFSEIPKHAYQLYEVSLMMYYMAKHRKDRAWIYFEEFVNWEVKAEDSIRLDFSVSILPLLKEGGKRHLPTVKRIQPYYREDRQYDLHALYEYYKTQAINLAQRFDSRNRTNHATELLYEELTKLNQSEL